MKLISVNPSTKSDKKFVATFCMCKGESKCCDKERKKTHFGAKGMDDYTITKDKKQRDFIDSSNSIKICATVKSDESMISYDTNIELPITLKEINTVVENIVAKKKFSKNSSIVVKDYLLNKNEKKLSKSNQFIILTEKEVQLIELFLHNKKPVSKDNILSSIWNYSADADTHTVETHIYRLRKKISDKFIDEKFILNNKDGYYL